MKPKLVANSITLLLVASAFLTALAMGQAQLVAQDPATEAIIKAIRDEIWATNQMQLGAFYENHRITCPEARAMMATDPPNAFPIWTGKRRPKWKRIAGVSAPLAVALLITLGWVIYLAWPAWRRAKKEYKPKMRKHRNGHHIK